MELHNSYISIFLIRCHILLLMQPDLLNQIDCLSRLTYHAQRLRSKDLCGLLYVQSANVESGRYILGYKKCPWAGSAAKTTIISPMDSPGVVILTTYLCQRFPHASGLTLSESLCQCFKWICCYVHSINNSIERDAYNFNLFPFNRGKHL